jgi:16S rRNA (cytosine1402-N4)-methyltransferase
MEDRQRNHQRRIRYKGTHPKKFGEKYKELQPEKYSADVSKVMEQGKTPAGMHRSICIKEILDVLKIKPGQTGVDATLGYGGHTLEMLKCVIPAGKIYALDVDPVELPKTELRLRNLGYGTDILEIRQMNFSEIDNVIIESGPVNFILADLGVSSMQIDNPERGFSYKTDAPLDLRMDQKNGLSASELLMSTPQDTLEEILFGNADEPHFEKIADAITKRIKKGEIITTTKQLRDIIGDTLSFLPDNIRTDEVKKSCQRCFQALRIEVNDEFNVLDKFLDKIPEVLTSGGRIAVLSFHSGEDRRVKKSFQYYFREGIYSDIAPAPIRPTDEECRDNPRAKSAKLRWAIKT